MDDYRQALARALMGLPPQSAQPPEAESPIPMYRDWADADARSGWNALKRSPAAGFMQIEPQNLIQETFRTMGFDRNK